MSGRTSHLTNTASPSAQTIPAANPPAGRRRARYWLRPEVGGALLFDRTASSTRLLTSSAAAEWAFREDTFCLPDNGFRRGIASTPVKVFLEITRNCNLTCNHCYNNSGPGHSEDTPLSNLLARVDSIGAAGVFVVKITGGEPAVRLDLPQVVQRIVSWGMSVDLTTNGTYSDAAAHRLASLPWQEITISLEGPRRIHDRIRGLGSFDRIVRNSRVFVLQGQRVRFNAIVRQETISHLDDLVGLAAEVGANVRFIPLRPSGRAGDIVAQMVSSEQYIELAERVVGLRLRYPETAINTDFDLWRNVGEEAKKETAQRLAHPTGLDFKNCSAAIRNAVIEYDGTVVPCGFLGPLSSDFEGGNIDSEPLLDIWQASETFERTRNLVKRVHGHCNSCDFKSGGCSGHCPAVSLAIGSSLDATDPHCPAPTLIGRISLTPSIDGLRFGQRINPVLLPLSACE